MAAYNRVGSRPQNLQVGGAGLRPGDSMGAYIVRRLALMIPTLFGIMMLSFLVIQFAPGGPVEQAIARLTGSDVSAMSRVTGTLEGDFSGQQGVDSSGASSNADQSQSAYRGARGLSPQFIAQLE